MKIFTQNTRFTDSFAKFTRFTICARLEKVVRIQIWSGIFCTKIDTEGVQTKILKPLL